MFPRPAFKNSSTSNIPPLRFPQKLWKIANECQSGAVSWSPHGKSILLRYSLFKEEFMSTKSDFFKTDNISSFVRQLNLYGFRKVYDHAHKQTYKANPDLHEFSNLHFQRDMPELLDKVTRKSGILKDRNDFLPDNQQIPDTSTELNHETKCDIENYNNKENRAEADFEIEQKCSPDLHLELTEDVEISDIPPPLVVDVLETPPTQPPESVTDVQPVKKKRGRKPGSKRDPNKPRVRRYNKLNFKKRKQVAPRLKRPDLFPNLIFYDDEDDSPYLRNTSRDVMLSSTQPFQESPEYLELEYQSHFEPLIRPGHATAPWSILYHNKIAPDSKQSFQEFPEYLELEYQSHFEPLIRPGHATAPWSILYHNKVAPDSKQSLNTIRI